MPNQIDNLNERRYWLAFDRISNFGSVKFQKIINFFDSLEQAWQADWQLLRQAGLSEKEAQETAAQRSQIRPEAEAEATEQAGLKFFCLTDQNYPTLLKEIHNPPPVVYYRGEPAALNRLCLAVVGTRSYSPYGERAAQEIAAVLAKENITVISGLALGIDAIAHRACLEAGGLTVAVLGSGVDWPSVYPASNRYLAKKIIESGGLVLSDYPPRTLPSRFSFPARNRLIAGLAKGVIVIEAPENSGSLITAQHALEQNREIFAVPGSIYSRVSQGCNQLIKNGAKLVQSIDDILDELNLKQTEKILTKESLQSASAEEKIILELLSAEPLHIDKIANCSKLKINALSSLLTMMEIKGLVKDTGGRNYILNN